MPLILMKVAHNVRMVALVVMVVSRVVLCIMVLLVSLTWVASV